MFNISDLSHISVIISLLFVITSFAFTAGLKELTHNIRFINIRDSKYLSATTTLFFILGALKGNEVKGNITAVIITMLLISAIIAFFYYKFKEDLFNKNYSDILSYRHKNVVFISLLIISLIVPPVFGYFTPPIFLKNFTNKIFLCFSIFIYFFILWTSIFISGTIYSISRMFTLKKYTIITSTDLNIPFVKNKKITGYLISEEKNGIIIKPLDHKAIYIKKDLINIISPGEIDSEILIIDRFEGDYTVIEYNNNTFNLPRSFLPNDAKEGDVLNISTTIDREK